MVKFWQKKDYIITRKFGNLLLTSQGMKLAIEEEYARTEEVKLDICIL